MPATACLGRVMFVRVRLFPCREVASYCTCWLTSLASSNIETDVFPPKSGAAEDPAMVIHPAGHASGSAWFPLPGDTPAGYPTARHGRLWTGLLSRTDLHRSARPSGREARPMPWITPTAVSPDRLDGVRGMALVSRVSMAARGVAPWIAGGHGEKSPCGTVRGDQLYRTMDMIF
jgi:hypothetical protein